MSSVIAAPELITAAATDLRNNAERGPRGRCVELAVNTFQQLVT
jgi:hypothetical protein